MAVLSEKKEDPVVCTSKVRGRKPLKVKELLRKKALGWYTHNTKQVVVSDNAGNYKRQKRANAEANSSAMEQAREVQANLAPEFPSMVKYMLPSHVTGGFWLGLPRKFCIGHLPKHDTMIGLEDESGEEYETRYLVDKVGLSGGWRWFSIAHNLVEGDVIVFHLVMPSKFKVYIVRSNGSDEVDGALGLLKLDACMQMVCEKDIISVKTEDISVEPLQLEIPQENNEKNSLMTCDANLRPLLDQSENESEDLGSEVLDGIKLSESVVYFKEVKNMENFNILVNGLIINSELSKHLQTKYYELCCSQSSFLHVHLLEGLNCRLAAGMISETINIADAIRASKLTTPQDHFMIWEKTLKAFEDLGMNVGFLRARLDQLMSLAVKSTRFKEIRVERVHAEKEMKTLEAKLFKVKEVMNRLDSEIETHDMNADGLEHMFQEVATAPW